MGAFSDGHIANHFVCILSIGVLLLLPLCDCASDSYLYSIFLEIGVIFIISIRALHRICRVLTEGECIQLEAFAAYIDYDGMRSVTTVKRQIIESLSIKHEFAIWCQVFT